MAWLRAVAGQNTPTSFKVEYNLTGLTTTGSDTAPAYGEFTFVLAGSGNRVPPATINIYCDGTLLTSNTDYTYNRNTGEVKIKRVAGNILVEAVGVVAAAIWSPAAGYTYFAIFQLSGKYRICWYSSVPENEWKPVYGTASISYASIITVTPYVGLRGYLYYSQEFNTIDAAINAMYREEAAQYVQASSLTVYQGAGRSGVNSATATIGGLWPNRVIATNASVPIYALTYYEMTANRSTTNSSSSYSSTPSVPEQYVEYSNINIQS
ncbi:MAG: hypothetical protein II881_02770 [Oscillospiraceae bacterium]|nr:hypothetical protein [Oscillospiraceae bacterium]